MLLLLTSVHLAIAQDVAADDPWKALLEQIQELRGELAASRQETKDLRREVQELRDQISSQGSAAQAPQAATSESQAAAIEALADDQRLLEAKVNEHEQSKVSSGSKYHVRLSGLALFNAFHAAGAVDNSDLPKSATPASGPHSSIGASLRQSIISLEVFGPEWKGARATGDVAFDFFGGFPNTSEGIANGLVRLRTANLKLDWKNVSVVAGQDTPFFSPLSPTSLVSSAYPALASEGNLWTWTPQLYVEHRTTFADESQQLSLRAGVLDPLTGELPAAEYNRLPTAGEHSGQPAYALHLGWRRGDDDRPLGFGLGGYYSRQHWGDQSNVDAWAATADWQIPLGAWFALSGELYRGRALGGLGGGASGSVLFLNAQSALALDSAGGWSQLKFKPREKIEFNAAFGEDTPFRSGLSRRLPADAASVPSRNASGYLNTIFHARSNLLFSMEYRRLWTSYFASPKRTADYIALGAGIVF